MSTDIIQRIREAKMRHTMRTGETPTAIYMGLLLWAQLDQHPDIVTTRIYTTPPPAPPMRGGCEFEGVTIYRVLEDPEHFRVVGDEKP